MKSATALLVLGVLTAASAPLAASPVQPPPMGHDRMGHSGKPASPARNAFTALDANRDGRLSRTEFARHRLGAHFSMLDTSHDGSLNQAEFAATKRM
jgi:hypothetical protein